MQSDTPKDSELPEDSSHGTRALWVIAVGCLVVVLIAVFLPRPASVSSDRPAVTNAKPLANASYEKIERMVSPRKRLNSPTGLESAKTAEEIVAEKVSKFAQNRRAIASRIARRMNQDVPPEIEAFFNAVESGNWDEIHSRWKELATQNSKRDRPDIEPYWAAVLDSYGVAEQAHEWPAQRLLDYGNSILDSLRPDMVYVGGTDNGRWVPELLNETSGDPHIIVTQNALADGTYLDYLRELYGGRFNTLSQEDSQRAFQEYTADAQKRLEHDRQFPDEPKQMRPGEQVTEVDGHVQASGAVAVMLINEKILQILMQKNPDLSFALQESFPLRGTYADAVPLGPLMELGVNGAQNVFTAERATQSVDYWRAAAELVLTDPQAASSDTALKSYSHDINSTANLLAAHNFTAEAEQAYRLASQVCPYSPEPVGGLATILARTGHPDEARELLDNFARNYPDQRSAIETFRGSITVSLLKPSL